MSLSAERNRFYVLTTLILSQEATDADLSEHRRLLRRPEWRLAFDELKRCWDAVSTPPTEKFNPAVLMDRLDKALDKPELSPARKHRSPRQKPSG